jgi:UDP-glucuronate 4-epimerase
MFSKPAQLNADWPGEHPDLSTSRVPCHLYNIGNSNPVNLLTCIEILEKCLNKEAIKNFLPLQPGDVSELMRVFLI